MKAVPFSAVPVGGRFLWRATLWRKAGDYLAVPVGGWEAAPLSVIGTEVEVVWMDEEAKNE